ncbi:hypothetical protein GH714_007491 [Hevea brasiliensis]|uniref:Transcriptional corepressor SEUSS n=1 Tax=Hevea brasiliensis TaxID=3981 RepID=A0A6A6KU38_HEVBR|nr:hypothetical protein GH714_007491 [Hevea brasiliensis]
MMESNPVSIVPNDVGFTPSLAPLNLMNSVSSGQIPSHSGSSTLSDQQQYQIQQFEPQRFQHGQQSMQQLPVSRSQPQQQQPQFQSIRGGLGVGGSVVPVKLEPDVMNDQIGLQPKLQSLQSLAAAAAPPHVQAVFSSRHCTDEFFTATAHFAAAAAATGALPQQRPQSYQQSQQQNGPIRSAVRTVYEPGTCAQRLIQYMYQQQHRPADNNIEFWRKFVLEFFANNARKRWCVSLYGNSRQTNGVFHQDLWHCEICNHKPGRGFETTVEVLPRLFKIKYDSGTLEELLCVDMPHEYQNSNGQIVLDYAKRYKKVFFSTFV